MLQSFGVAICAALILQARAFRKDGRIKGAMMARPESLAGRLSGLWKSQARWPLSGTHFDVVPTDSVGRSFQAFPISHCSEGGRLKLSRRGYFCDDIVELSIEPGANNFEVVIKDRVDGQTGNASDGDRTEADLVGDLVWKNGEAPWTQDFGKFDGLEEWDDAECRAFSGAAANDPLEYKVQFGASASLSLHNLPGVTGDAFACVASSWLAKHRGRFECILRKASEAQANDGSKAQGGIRPEGLRRALAKLESVMPDKNDLSSACNPSVCLQMSMTQFPVPSPVPTVALQITWPMSLASCNGMDLRRELDEVKNDGGADLAVRLNEVANSTSGFSGGGGHGFNFVVFPIPATNYFVQGAGKLSWMSGKRQILDDQQLQSAVVKDSERLDKLMLKAMDACPDLQRRFELHGKALGRDTRGSMADRQAIARAFPELSTPERGGGHRYGVGGGAYGQIGPLGVATGVFGGGSIQGQQLGKKFNGCAAWKTVIQEWHTSPLADVAALA